MCRESASSVGLFGFNFLLPSIVHNVFESGTSIFFELVAQPVSTKYPLWIFFGLNKITLSVPLRVSVYFLNTRSSIIPPTNEIDPSILSFSNSTLLVLFIVLDIKIPHEAAQLLNTLLGRIVVAGAALGLLMNNQLLGVLAIVAGYELLRRSENVNGGGAKLLIKNKRWKVPNGRHKYIPSEASKQRDFNALNQFPENLLNVFLGSIEEIEDNIPEKKIDLILCNILAPVIKSLGPSFKKVIGYKGKLILSGLLVEQIKVIDELFLQVCWHVVVL